VLRPIYDWLLRKAASPRAPLWLFMLAVSESVFLPIPPDFLLAPMVLAKPKSAYRNAVICMLGSVAGGCISYGIAYWLRPYALELVALTGNHLDMKQYQQWFDQYGVWVILAKGLTPFPYMIICIASGLAHFTFWKFAAASLVTRGGRFFLTAWLLKRYGPQIQVQVEKNLLLWGTVIVAALVGLWFVVHRVLQ
jgi:membrane protein YqaA with SNARE-associated domain